MTVDIPNIAAVRVTPTKMFYWLPDDEAGVECGPVR